MDYFLVEDASGWKSSMVFKTVAQAILSQGWRIKELDCVKEEDFPITILTFNTKFLMIHKCIELSKEEFIREFDRIKAAKNGGANENQIEWKGGSK